MNQLTGYNTYMPTYMRNQPTYMPQTQPYTYNTGTSGINWVLGVENAKSFYVEPGKSVILMDSERPVFYIKSVDFNGMGSIKAYEFTETSTEPKVAEPVAATPAIDLSKYVTKDELAALIEELRTKHSEEVRTKALI